MKLTFPLFNTSINVSVDEPVADSKRSRRFVRSKRNDPKSDEPAKEIPQVEQDNVATETDTKLPATPVSTPVSPSADAEVEAPPVQAVPIAGSPQPLLMAEVVNVTHEKFRQTEEIKVLIYIFIFWWFVNWL